jgi:hypothetical protein
MTAGRKAAVYAAILAATVMANSQVSQERIQRLSSQLSKAKHRFAQLPIAQTKRLPANGRVAYFADFAEQWLAELSKGTQAAKYSGSALTTAATSYSKGVAAVNNPSTDFAYSAFTGFTQSTSSVAQCGASVVVGFNDSGAFFETAINGSGGVGLAGVAYSNDGGASFTDVSPIPAGSNTLNILLGEPVVACSDASTFYYTQTFLTADVNDNQLTSIALSTSTDGGATWSNPKVVVDRTASTYTFDKDWIAIDPSDHKRVYISYSDLDTTFTSKACPDEYRSAVELVASADGGKTFGSPIIVDQVCGVANASDNSHLIVGSNGLVYMAWERYVDFPSGTRDIMFSTLSPSLKLSHPVLVDQITAGGDTYQLEGGFSNIYGLDLGVDRSHGPSDGALYITWDDGRGKSVPDLFSQTGTYAFDDILLRRSLDGGTTWGTAPTKVNSDSNLKTAAWGHDHFQPAIAVDNMGEVAICWYDRRNDPENLAIERWCGTSIDHALSWSNARVNVGSFGPVHATDELINPAYMGDYDAIAVDFTNAERGFIGSFQVMDHRGNPDVKAVSFSKQ